MMKPPLQWACLGPTRPAAPTNGTVEAAHSSTVTGVAIYRGGSITSRPYKWPTYKKTASPSYSSGHSLQPVKEMWGGLGHLPKIALLREEGFDLKSFGGEVVEGKKILFHIFFEVLMVG